MGEDADAGLLRHNGTHSQDIIIATTADTITLNLIIDISITSNIDLKSFHVLGLILLWLRSCLAPELDFVTSSLCLLSFLSLEVDFCCYFIVFIVILRSRG